MKRYRNRLTSPWPPLIPRSASLALIALLPHLGRAGGQDTPGQAGERAGVVATSDDEEATPQTPVRWADDDWGLEFRPVPAILRLHCPVLRDGRGRLIADVAESSPAAQLGLRPGDVLLEVNGQPLLKASQLPARRAVVAMLVLREGVLNVVPRWQSMPHAPADLPAHSARAFAQSAASGGESMSVSRAGDVISLEYRSPETGAESVRLHGTVDEIEQQMRERQLSPAVCRKIRESLGS